MRKHIVIIGNPIAGGNAVGKIEKAAAIMRSKGIDVKLLLTAGKGDAEAFAKEIASAPPLPTGELLVVAAGGDGTYNEVANGLVHSDTPMAILPLGTTSVLAKELNLPHDIGKAVHVALEGKTETIHLGKITLKDSNTKNSDKLRVTSNKLKTKDSKNSSLVTRYSLLSSDLSPSSDPLLVTRHSLLVTDQVTRYFLLMAGAGFDGEVTFGISEKIKRYTGKGAYIFSGIRTFIRYAPPLITLRYRESPGGPMKRVEGYAAIIGKATCYGGAFKATPDTSLKKPYFHVFLTCRRGRFDLLRYVAGVVRGCHLSYPDTANFRATEIEVDGDVHIQIDGDYAGTAPARIEVVRNALQLVTGI